MGQPLNTQTDVEHAIEFLSWLFGEHPAGYIYVLRERPSSDPVEARQGKSDLRPQVYSAPEKLDSMWWHEQSHRWNQMFATTLVRERAGNNNAENCTLIPGVWADIDGCKELGISGSEFHQELKNAEEVSAWVRSSENGIQLWYKFAKPFDVAGDKERFAEELAGLLYDICLYYGGDPKVVNIGRTMRLPGSLNVKPEYDQHYMAQATIYPDNVYTLKELRTRFKPNPDVVPRLVKYACVRALSDVYEPGERHEIMLRLCGSVRKHGINREACSNLVRELCAYFHDNDDRQPDVETTYETAFDEIATLHQDYESIATPIEDAIDFWVELKKRYCKKRGFDFWPENVDPTQAPVPDGPFWVRGHETWYHGRDADECFANFIIRLKGRIIKADSLASVWLAEVVKAGEPPVTIEIPAEKHNTWQRFSTIPGLPSGLSLLAPTVWAQYIAWLDTQCPDSAIIESHHYGILNVEKNQPTILLPGVDHPNYIWTGTEDTALPGVYNRTLGKDETIEYLEEFLESYTGYHERRFIWPALGWFAACSISAILRQELKGFPILMICGLPGSGKTQLIRDVLGPHIGCQAEHSYKGTTTFALKRRLCSNNICPMIVDEFRLNAGAMRDDRKATETQDIIRNLHDGTQTSQGRASGEVTKELFVAPLCMIGEHHFTDEATIHRTFSIRLTRNWMNKVKGLEDAEFVALQERHVWLHDSQHKGKLGITILNYVERHLDEIPDIIDTAQKIIEADCPIKIERKVKGFVSVMTGLVLLERICASHDVAFGLNHSQMRKAVYAADTQLEDAGSYDTETLRLLFEATDHIIVNAFRQHSTLLGSLYLFDLDNPEHAYFDMGRWFTFLARELSGASSGTLTDKQAFRALLQDHHAQGDSPFIDFPTDHPIFPASCVMVDIGMIQARYGINVLHWRGYDET